MNLGLGITIDGTHGGFRRRDDSTYYLILVTGQSNANGGSGPALSSPTFAEPTPLMFNGGIRPGAAGANTASLIALAESGGVETVCTGLAHRLQALAPGKQFVFAVSAEDGGRYTSIKQGTTTYQRLLDYAQDLVDIATIEDRAVRVLACVAIHGEAETQFGTTTAQYAADMAEWQDDLETDLQAITEQDEAIPLFCCQQINYGPTSYPNSRSAISQYIAHVADPTQVVLIGARYIYSGQVSDGGSIHMRSHACRWHGQRYAEAIYERQLNGANWKPLSPVAGGVTISGTTVTLPLNVWHPPVRLAYDYCGRRADHGFKFFDDSGSPPTITAVSVASPTTLSLTLSGAPTGTAASFRLRYCHGATGATAFTGDNRGNVADSAPDVSAIDGLPLHNWLVSFEETVT